MNRKKHERYERSKRSSATMFLTDNRLPILSTLSGRQFGYRKSMVSQIDMSSANARRPRVESCLRRQRKKHFFGSAFFSFIRLTASFIASQLYCCASHSVIRFASLVANKISLCCKAEYIDIYIKSSPVSYVFLKFEFYYCKQMQMNDKILLCSN